MGLYFSMNPTTEKIGAKVAKLGLAAVENSANHVTIIGGVRRVQIWTTGTVYAEQVPKEWKRFKSKNYTPISYAISKAVELAKKGYIKGEVV